MMLLKNLSLRLRKIPIWRPEKAQIPKPHSEFNINIKVYNLNLMFFIVDKTILLADVRCIFGGTENTTYRILVVLKQNQIKCPSVTKFYFSNYFLMQRDSKAAVCFHLVKALCILPN